MTKEPLRIYYVYILYDENGVPFYVGKGKGDRWLHHELDAKNCKEARNARLLHKIRQIWSLGYDIQKAKVLMNVSQSVAFNYEKVLIKIIGRKEDGGTLLNFSLGGKEGKDRPKSEYERKRVSEVHTGKKLTEWHKQRLREYSTGRIFSEEHKLNLSESRRGKPRSEETKKKIVEFHTGRKRSEETIKRLKEAYIQRRIKYGKPRKKLRLVTRRVSEDTRRKLREAWARRKAGATANIEELNNV